MVGKFIANNPLTIEERRKIKEAIDLKMSYGQMALHVGRFKSVVMREAKRLGKYSSYDPDEAQKDFEKKTDPNRYKKYGYLSQIKKKERKEKNVRGMQLANEAKKE